MKKFLLIISIIYPILLLGQETYNPSIDGYMKSSNEGNGTSPYLAVGKLGSVEYRSVLKFNLSDIESDATVVSAILKIYRGGQYTAPNSSIYAYRATDSWSESNINWGNPNYNTTSYSSNSGGSTWMEWDITNLVQKWVDGTYTNYGVYLKANSSVSQLYEYFSNNYSTSAYRPKLVVELESTVPFEVTEPDDNSVWQQGESNVDIEWETGNYGGNVSIHLFQNGNSIYTIRSSTNNDGSYGSWDVPIDCPAGNNYYVRIQTLSPTPYHVAVSETFEVEEMGGIIEITQPNSSTSWSLGQENVPINWETGDIPGEVKIELHQVSSNNLIETIINSTDNDGSYTWNVPENLDPGTNYKIKIQSLYNTAKFDVTDYFEIAYDPTPIATITSIQQSETDVDPSDPFLLTIKLKNTGDASATNGGISVSFPDFTATNQWGSNSGYMSEHGTVLSQSVNTTLPNIEAFGSGETIYNSNGNAITAQYLLFESTKENWSTNEEQTLMLVVTPQVPGELNMKVRGWFQYENDGLSVDPGASGSGVGTDQQGFYTYEETITVNQVLPDLTVNQINTPSSVDPGETYDMSYIIKNIGNQVAPLSATEIRISQNQNFNDGVVVANHNTPVLDINETWSSVDFPFTVPNNFVGDNYILVKSDAATLINELDEDNNIGVQPLYITTPLSIQANSPSSNISVSQGENVNIQWTGAGESDASVFIRYDLDNVWNNGNETTIALNQDLSGSYNWNTSNIPFGTYYIVVVNADNESLVYDYADGTVQIGSSADITMQLHQVTDINDNPKTSFIPGEPVKVTFRAKNEGDQVNVVTVCNIQSNNGEWPYDSNNEGENNEDPLPNDGNWHYYSFIWEIPESFNDFGECNIGASIRDANDFSIIYETTCLGANTGFECEYILNNAFEIISVEDNTPPEIEIWKVYQTGDLKFHIIARVTDNGVGVNPSTVKVQYRKYPGDWNTIGRTKTMNQIPNYNDFYTVEVSPDYPFNFENGDAAIFKMEAKDFNGNINKYPESKPCIDVHETDPDFGNYCGRMFIWDEEHLNSNNTFQYYNFGSGAISYRMDGDDIKIYNNTSIWYTMETVPDDLNVEQTGLWSTTMLTPKSGLLPLNRDDWFGDRSVSIYGPIDDDFITIKSDRKSTNAIIRNTWDMVWIALKPKLPDIPNARIKSIINAVSEEIDLYNTLEAIKDRDYYEIVSICIDEIFDEETQTILIDKITAELVDQGFSSAQAFANAFKVVSGAWDIITGINNRSAFIKDIFMYPFDTDEFSMSKSSPLYIDEVNIPGSVNSNGNTKFFVNENIDFFIPVNVPLGNTQSYFQTYALVNLYSTEGDLIETTYINNYNYDLQGFLNVTLTDFCVDQGAEWNAHRFNNAIPINIEYDFSQSSKGHSFESNTKPYYIEVKFYQGGLPGLDVAPFEPDELINTGLVPFRLFDHINPTKPDIAFNSANNTPLQIGFVVIPIEKDIDYYKVFRKIDGESDFIQVDSILNGSKEELFYYDQFEEAITSVEYKIQAVDISGNMSELSDPHLIEFITSPPTQFELIAPEKWESITNLTPELQWQESIDPDNTLVSYEIYLSNEINYQNPTIIDNIEVNSYQFINNLNDNSIYYWKVKAIDETNEIRWSLNEDWSFIVNQQNDSPNSFNLLLPQNNNLVSELRPVFEWEEAIDVDPFDEVSYKLMISEDINFNNPFLFEDIKEPYYEISFDLLQNHQYYWKVIATDENQGVTESSIFSFETYELPNRAPELNYCGGIYYEASGVYPKVGTETTNFVFKVVYSDLDNDAPLATFPKVHLLYENNEIDGSPFTMSSNSATEYLNGREFVFEIMGLNSGLNYSYYFDAYDLNNEAATGEATQLINDIDVIEVEITSPQTNDAFTHFQICNIEWISNGNFDSYSLYYSYQSDIWDTIIEDISGVQNYLWEIPEISSNTVIIAISGSKNGQIAYDTLSSIQIAAPIDPPSAFSLIAPNQTEETTRTPQFQWEASTDPDGSNVSYELWYATNPNFSNRIAISDIATNSYTPTTNLNDNATYYWKVKAIDENDQVTWSNEQDWYFWINTTNNAPNTFALSLPLNESMLQTTFPTFEWTGSIDVDPNDEITYTLWISENNQFDTYLEYTDIDTTSFIIPDALNTLDYYFWKVKAVDNHGAETWNIGGYWWFHTPECPAPLTGVIEGEQIICANTIPSEIYFSSEPSDPNDVYTYQWQISLNNSYWQDIEGQVSNSYQPNALQNTSYFRVKIESENTCGPTYSNLVEINVLPQLQGGAICPNQTVCYGSIPDTIYFLTYPSGGIGVYTYQWQQSIDHVNWNNIPGATSSYHVPGFLETTSYYRVEVIDSCGIEYSNVDTLIVIHEPIAIAGSNDTIYETDTYQLDGLVQNHLFNWWSNGNGDGVFSDSSMLNAIYSPGTNDIANGFVVLKLHATPLSPCQGSAVDSLLLFIQSDQQIDLWSGWNLMSFNKIPDDPAMQMVLSELLESSSAIKVIDEKGNFIQYIPEADWLNTIGDMENTEGYYIKMASDSVAEIIGLPVTFPFEIPLQTGWNIMGYPFQDTTNAIEVLQPLIDSLLLVKTISESGGFVQFIPGEGWINTIGDFYPGEGYYIKVTEDCSLIFSINTPELTTDSVYTITHNSAMVNSTISSNGGAPVLSRGVCWSTSPNPTLEDNYTNDGGGSGVFVSNITSLDDDAIYYVRAYATNRMGIAYGNEISYSTLPAPFVCGYTLYDSRDGQSYGTVLIGDQCWMTENLNIGIRIDGANAQTNNSIVEKYCHSNDDVNCDIYGGLYQWDEMMQYVSTEGVQGICPSGWYLPTDNDWKTMEMHLGMPQAQADAIGWRGTDEGGKMKEMGIIHWNSPNTAATNISGFTALAGAGRTSSGSFIYLGYSGTWWASSEYPSSRVLGYNTSQIGRNGQNKEGGYSVRCLSNNFITNPNQPPSQPTSPLPIDSAQNQPIDIDLNWSCSDPEGDTLTYDVYFGLNSIPPLVSSSITDTTYDPGTLNSDYTYYWKIVAHDNNGNTTVGDIWQFSTLEQNPTWQCGDTILDPRDGQIYNTVLIGDQCWMAENLNIGIAISASSGGSTDNSIIEKTYKSSEADLYFDQYGGLYEWNEMMDYEEGNNDNPSGIQGICPPNGGWHIPSLSEWQELNNFIGNVNSGGKIKETGFTHWLNPNTGATNEYGFTALPGGLISYHSLLISSGIGYSAAFWSSTPGSTIFLENVNAEMSIGNMDLNNWASVRCLKN